MAKKSAKKRGRKPAAGASRVAKKAKKSPAPKKAASKKSAKKAAGRGRPATKKAAKKGAKKGAKKAAGRGRPKGSGKKGSRKPRVNIEIKRKAVAAALKKYPKGTALRTLRTDLEKVKDPRTGVHTFAPPDFNSAEGFGKRLLPAGWKIQGERRNARVVKK